MTELATHVAIRRQTLDRLRGLLIRDLKVRREPDELDPDVPLFGTGLRLDSVDAVELVVSVEAEFGVRLLPEKMSPAALRTLNTLVDLVIKEQNNG